MTVVFGRRLLSLLVTLLLACAGAQLLAEPALAATITVNPTSGLVTTEAGGTATFTVRLNTISTAPVTVELTSSDTTEGTIGPPSSIVLLMFQPNATALNPQAITVTGQNDVLTDGNVAYTIVLAPATSADPAYNNEAERGAVRRDRHHGVARRQEGEVAGRRDITGDWNTAAGPDVAAQ